MANHIPMKHWILSEAAGLGAWGRTFQVWASWFSWGTCGGANGVSISQAPLAKAARLQAQHPIIHENDNFERTGFQPHHASLMTRIHCLP